MALSSLQLSFIDRVDTYARKHDWYTAMKARFLSVSGNHHYLWLAFDIGFCGPRAFHKMARDIIISLQPSARTIPVSMLSTSFINAHGGTSILVYEIPGKGFAAYRTASFSGVLEFYSESSSIMAWRREQLDSMQNAMSTIDSFEFNKEGVVTSQPDPMAFREAVQDVRASLRRYQLMR